MKRILSLTLALLLAAVLMLPVTAGAFSDYDLAYDATDQLDPDFMRTLGEDTFYQLTEAGGVQVRTDVVEDLEGETIQDYAQYFYDHYDYGYGEDASCINLMIVARMEDGSLVCDDHYVFLGGGADQVISADMLQQLNTALDPFFSPDVWSGGLEQDVMVCENALVVYASFLNSLLAGGAVAIPTVETAAAGDTDSAEIVRAEEENTGDDLLLISPAPQDTAQGTYVLDFAGLLTEQERSQLENMAASASEKYDSGVYVVTVNDYRDYNSESPYEAAKTIYREYDLGLGSDNSGTMLMLSMDDRDYAYIATGEFGNYAFTDYGKDKLEQEFLDDFRNNDWYSGFYDFISESERYMAKAAAGNPVDVEHVSTAAAAGGSVVLGAAVSCAGSAIKCNGLKKKMKSVKTHVDATQYISGGPAITAEGVAAGAAAGLVGGIILRAATDQFVNTTVTRVPIVVNDNDHKGGWSGGTTIDSGGFSGHSGKF